MSDDLSKSNAIEYVGDRSADAPAPERCNSEIFENGTCIGIVAGASALVIEAWVQLVAARSGQRIDWHYVGGRARVLALGDVQRAKQEFLYSRMIFGDV